MDYSPRYGCFRALLREIREEAGLTQTQLAEKLGKPQTFVSKSELGERRIDFLETLDFLKACGVTLEMFLEAYQVKLAANPEIHRSRRKSPRKMDDYGRVGEQ